MAAPSQRIAAGEDDISAPVLVELEAGCGRLLLLQDVLQAVLQQVLLGPEGLLRGRGVEPGQLPSDRHLLKIKVLSSKTERFFSNDSQISLTMFVDTVHTGICKKSLKNRNLNTEEASSRMHPHKKQQIQERNTKWEELWFEC